MRGSHFALALLVAVLVLALPPAAGAKGLEPIRVVSLSGRVGWIRGASARAWWTDFYDRHACLCSSPADVAKFESRLMGHARYKSYDDGSWPPAMLVQAGHTAPMLYYPASSSTPPYLVTPAVQGSHGLRWDDWNVVTPRMERIMTAALEKGTVSTYTGGSTTFPTGWAVGGGLAALLLAGLGLGAWRRPEFAARLRPVREGQPWANG